MGETSALDDLGRELEQLRLHLVQARRDEQRLRAEAVRLSRELQDIAARIRALRKSSRVR
jgi:hypothetical protein